MIKWIWRILYFIVVLFVGLQIFGFGQVQQLSTYYNENAKNLINSPNDYMIHMNTLLGLSYFREEPNLFEFTSDTEGEEFSVVIKTVGALSEDLGVDGFAIMVYNFYNFDSETENKIFKLTIEMDEKTFFYGGEYQSRKTIVFDPEKNFSYDNLPIFFMFDYLGFNLDPENQEYVEIKRIELTFGLAEGDDYTFNDHFSFLATKEPSRAAATHKFENFNIEESQYNLISNFENYIPSEEQIASLNLNLQKPDISQYNYLSDRINIVYIIFVLFLTYFLFFNKKVIEYIKSKSKKESLKQKSNAIFKD